MKSLAILGGSGHGKVIADTALISGWEDVVFFDDAWPQKTTNSIWKIQGNSEELLGILNCFDGVIVGIGDAHLRLQKQHALATAGAALVSIYHPFAVISSFANIGIGSVVFAGAVVNVDVQIGLGVIVNTGATVDHDCLLSDGVHIAPGSHLSGDVFVGDGSWVGVGACVKEGVRIGKNVLVGAGAVVVSDLPDNVTVAGNPARIIKRD